MWTQVAPVAFENIGWKFYMVFISCAVVGAVIMFFTFPDTLNKPLEEVAAMFGDGDLVALYHGDFVTNRNTDEITLTEEKAQVENLQQLQPTTSRPYMFRHLDPPHIFY